MRRSQTAAVLAAVLVAACDGTGGQAGSSAATVTSTMVVSEAMRNSPGFALANRYCTPCHAAPDPQAHKASEWPSVVARMQENMRRLGKTVPSLQQTGAIVDYLQQFARQD